MSRVLLHSFAYSYVEFGIADKTDYCSLEDRDPAATNSSAWMVLGHCSYLYCVRKCSVLPWSMTCDVITLVVIIHKIAMGSLLTYYN